MTNKNSISLFGAVLSGNIWSAAVLAAAMALSGCAGVRLTATPYLPQAEGRVRYSVSKNDNTIILLTVDHLANPETITPPAGNYVVWTLDTTGAPAQNIGELKVDSDLNGVLYAETPLHSFDLFITVEASGQVQQPSGQRLLWTHHHRR